MSEGKELNSISALENVQLIECLFKYLRELDGNIQIEYLTDDCPSIAVKQIGTGYKVKENIIGGYDGEIPFVIYVRDYVSDTRKTLDITKPLNDMAIKFEEETDKGFKKLILPEGYYPTALEMTTTPEDVSGKEDNRAVFMAVYKLSFKRKIRRK